MNEIFTKQLQLQKLIHEKSPSSKTVYSNFVNRYDVITYVRDQAFYLNGEVTELMEALGGSRDILKPWKASFIDYALQNTKIDSHTKSEAIDMLCFAINICLIAGITPENVDEEYDKVWQKNIKRQQDGY